MSLLYSFDRYGSIPELQTVVGLCLYSCLAGPDTTRDLGDQARAASEGTVPVILMHRIPAFTNLLTPHCIIQTLLVNKTFVSQPQRSCPFHT
jgi:hypothetical protein